MNPILSIITINLNNADGLQKTIQSVIEQTYQKIEFIIIDGNSKDSSIEIIKKFEKKITHWKSEPDSGIYNAMNKGIILANGKYCLFLNSGDFLVDKQVIEKVFYSICYEDLLLGNCNVSKNGQVVHLAKPPQTITLKSFYKNTIPHQSTFIKRELFDRYGYYSEKYKINSDYDFWIKAIIQGNCSTKNLNLTIADYNLEGISSNIIENPEIHKEVFIILNNYFSKKILADYDDYYNLYNEISPFIWIRNHKLLKKILLFINKIIIKIFKVQ